MPGYANLQITLASRENEIYFQLVVTRLLSLAALVITAACRPAPPVVTAVDADRAHVELAQLQEGRSLLIHKCTGCHATPLPTEVPYGSWPEKLVEMSERARLDPPQRALIEQYLVTMAQR